MRHRKDWYVSLVAILLVATQLGMAQQPSASTAKRFGKATSLSEQDESSSTQSDGIKLHGHWMIEVRNPDGSLASHTEFENAIALPGKTMLVQFLSRAQIPGNWVVLLGDPTGPCMTGGKPWQCILREANDNITSSTAVGAINNSLTLSTPVPQQTISGIPQLILTGSATAANNSSIKSVSTILSYCTRTDSPPPSACSAYGVGAADASPASFSGATLTNPIAVTPGQAIQVVVTFTFS